MKILPKIPSTLGHPASRLRMFGLAALLGACLQMNAQSPAEELLKLERPMVIGHRGYPTMAPENTLPGFELAKLTGADMVELDYHVDRDGKAIVIHDFTLDRTTDAIRAWGGENVEVVEKSIAEMQTLDAGNWYGKAFKGIHLPTLEEALEVIQKDGGVTLIERKAGSPEHIVQLLREKDLVNEVVLQSFDWDYLKGVNELLPEQILGALGPQKTWKGEKIERSERELSPRWIDAALESGVKVVGWNGQVNAEAVAYAHEKGLKVLVYTINDLDEAKELLHMGVDGIITNNTAIIWKAIALLGE